MEPGSTEVKTQSESMSIKVEVSIPEVCLHSLMLIDDSPSVAIRKLVIRDFQQSGVFRAVPTEVLPSGEDRFRNIGTYAGDYKLNYNMYNADFTGNKQIVTRLERLAHDQSHPVWDQDNFDKLILTLMESMETREDIDELFSFLIAYGSGESNKPTAIQLKNRMSNQISESNPEIWNQHLRKCKARLTITAKNLNLPKPFGKPYGKSPNRKHPIDEDLLRLLIPWIDGSNERCQISLDDQSHEESIEILRLVSPPEFVLG